VKINKFFSTAELIRQPVEVMRLTMP